MVSLSLRVLRGRATLALVLAPEHLSPPAEQEQLSQGIVCVIARRKQEATTSERRDYLRVSSFLLPTLRLFFSPPSGRSLQYFKSPGLEMQVIRWYNLELELFQFLWLLAWNRPPPEEAQQPSRRRDATHRAESRRTRDAYTHPRWKAAKRA